MVHVEKGTCIKVMPYHQDPDLFLRNHSIVKNISVLKRSHFPYLTILILLIFEIVLDIYYR